MCITVTKVGQGHPDDNYYDRPIYLLNRTPYMSSYACHKRQPKFRSSRFHKVKVIVGEDANNYASKCTSLIGGFTAVVTTIVIKIILDLSYNCVSQLQK